jgi:hypothetical protein
VMRTGAAHERAVDVEEYERYQTFSLEIHSLQTQPLK